jgi:hypothetical protein
VANVTIREYADIAVTYSKYVQAGAEPAITDQQLVTSATSAQSAAFDTNTRIVAIATPATAVAVLFGLNPTALITSSMRLAANGVYFFGVKPGHKVAAIDVS